MSCSVAMLNITGFIPTAEEAKQASPYNVSESEALRYCDSLQHAIAYSETCGTSEDIKRFLGVFTVFFHIAEKHREARISGEGLALNLC